MGACNGFVAELLNRETAPVKVMYFLYCLGWGAFHPLLSVTLEDKGLSTTHIGLSLAGYSLSRILAGPMWSSLVDAYPHWAAEIFGVSAVICGGCAVLFTYLPMPVGLAPLFLYYIAETGHLPLLDTLTTHYVGEKKSDWGHQRILGSISWGIGVPLAGVLYDTDHYVYARLPPFIMTVCFCGVYLALKGPIVKDYAASQVGVRSAPSEVYKTFLAAVRTYMQPRLLFLLALVTLQMTGSILVLGYVFLYLKALGASKTLLGICVSVSVVSELPCFIVAGRLTRGYGVQRMVHIGAVAMAARHLAYCVITEPWQAVCIEWLHGITYAFTWSAALLYITDASPEGGRTMMVGILCSCSWGLGPLIFTSLGGLVYDEVDPKVLFSGYSALIVALVAVHWLLSGINPEKYSLGMGEGGRGEGGAERINEMSSAVSDVDPDTPQCASDGVFEGLGDEDGARSLDHQQVEMVLRSTPEV